MSNESEEAPLSPQPANLLSEFPVELKPLHPHIISVAKEDQVEEVIRPDIFYCPVTKPKDDGQKIGGIRGVDGSVISAYQRLVETGLFGWDSPMDAYRWALELGVQVAGRTLRDSRFSNELRVMRGLRRRVQAVRRERLFTEMVGYLTQDVAQLMSEGAVGDARTEFRNGLKEVESLNVDSLRDKMLTALASAFPGLYAEVMTERIAMAEAEEAARGAEDYGGDNEE